MNSISRFFLATAEEGEETLNIIFYGLLKYFCIALFFLVWIILVLWGMNGFFGYGFNALVYPCIYFVMEDGTYIAELFMLFSSTQEH